MSAVCSCIAGLVLTRQPRRTITGLLTKVERLLMENLFWSDEPVMEVVRAVEPWVQGLRRGISDNLHRATQPLYAYLSL